MEYDSKNFSDCSIYLENSNAQGDKIFDEKFGFHAIKKIDVMGISVDLLTNSKGDQII
ncbi:MAG: hypothetical protein ABGU93_12545 [Acetobacterium sp.]|uniref:hypothetical protein n=1 Tax=Acetobacterium sp. TaxID=1872094 RepID=UPI0032423842